MKSLVITEKYSVAKDFAEALKAVRVEDSFESDEYVIVWAMGHLFNLMNPEDYNEKYKKWSLKDLPIVPDKFRIKLTNKKAFEPIKQQLKRSTIDKVLVATDAGREGELIGRYILIGADNRKPVYRIWLNAMTKQDILQGLEAAKPIDGYNNLYLSAAARAECDWLLGINFTRAYSVRYGQGTPLTTGRCQTPILALIVQRDEEIEAFVPERYWEVDCSFKSGILGTRKYTGKWFNKHDGSTRIKSLSAAEEVCKRVKGQSGKVVKGQKELKKVSPALLFNQTNLQREANKKYGFSAQKTLDIAQKLYEQHKILSYPRTATRYIASSMKEQIVELLKLLNFDKFKEPIEAILRLPELDHSRIVNDSEVKEHTAIIPTLNTDLKRIYNTLEQDEKKIFDIVALNLIANYYDDYTYNSISIQTQVKQDMFITKGIEILNMGWRAVYSGSDDVENDESSVADIKEGTAVKADKPNINEVITEPPARYNEGSLLAVMENPAKLLSEQYLKEAIKGHGIGTDATRAGIIEILVQRKYIVRKGKELISTDTGRGLINLIDIPMLKSASLTAQWEQQLEAIAEGEGKKEKFIKSVEAMVAEGVRQIRGD